MSATAPVRPPSLVVASGAIRPEWRDISRHSAGSAPLGGMAVEVAVVVIRMPFG
jgi:hypothetical protein